MTRAVSKNSTIVRTPPLAIRAARTGLRFLSPRAPSLAARYAERLFLTAPRHRRPAAEAALLATGAPARIPHVADGEPGHLPAWTWGEGGDVVVLVHGWEGRGSQLGAFVDPLVARGLRVVTFDAPGHGDARSRTASVVEHARAVASVGRWITRGGGRVHAVVGHSVGGAAAVLATHFGLRPGRLALVAAPTSPERFARGFARMLALTDEVRAAMIARLERRYGLTMEELDVRAHVARLDVPVLVVHDRGDDVVPFADGAAIAEAAPAGRLVATEGLGHRRVIRAPEVVDVVAPFAADGVRAADDDRSAAGAAFARSLDDELYYRDARW